MSQIRHNARLSQTCEIVEFDTAALDACSADAVSELLSKARLVAGGSRLAARLWNCSSWPSSCHWDRPTDDLSRAHA